MSADGYPNLGELLLEAADLVKGQISVRLPAEVLSQNPETLRIDCRIAVKAFTKDPITDDLVPFEFPDLKDVPVAYPGGGGYTITWPLAAGDTVFLDVCDRSIEEWRDGDTVPITPADSRRFSLADAVAYPGGRRDSSPVLASGRAPGALVVDGSDIRLGGSTAAAFVALANLVDSRLESFRTTFNAHVHDGPPPATPVLPFATVAATKVKAE